MLLLLLINSYAADTHISVTSLCVHTFSVKLWQDACLSKNLHRIYNATYNWNGK